MGRTDATGTGTTLELRDPIERDLEEHRRLLRELRLAVARAGEIVAVLEHDINLQMEGTGDG